jgi:superfamily II DNA or RNA helicase
VVVLVNRQNLLDQTAKTLQRQGIRTAIVHGVHIRTNAHVVLSTVQTFKKRFPHGIKAPLVIVDECHMAIYDSYVNLLVKQGCRVLGFTATPFRLDKKKPMAKVYQQFAQPAKTHELIADGWLARPKYMVTDLDLSALTVTSSGEFDDESQDKVFANIDSLVAGIKANSLGKALVFCTRVAKSHEIAEALAAAGVPAAAIHGGMDDNERKRLIALLETSLLAALVNADLLTFGFDMPSLNTVAIYRATTSLALWHQIIGRAARPHPGKDFFRVLDFGGNVIRLGLWEEDIDWQQHFDPPPRKLEPVPAVKVCKAIISDEPEPIYNAWGQVVGYQPQQCGAFNVTTAKVCIECGAEFTSSGSNGEKPREEVEAKLVEYSGGRMSDHDVAAMSPSELILFAQARQYKKRWIHHELARRHDGEKQLTKYFEITGKPDPASSAASVLINLGYR